MSRPVVDSLRDGTLRVRMEPRHVDPTLQEHTFTGIDIPEPLQKNVDTVRFIVFTINGQEHSTPPVLAEGEMLRFGGFHSCRLGIVLTATYLDILRANGFLCLEILLDQQQRLAKVNCLDLTFLAAVSAPVAKHSTAQRVPALSLR